MNGLGRMRRWGAMWRQPPAVAAALPYVTHVTDQLVRLSSGHLWAAWQIDGWVGEGRSLDDRSARHAAWDRAIQTLCQGNDVLLWVHRFHQPVQRSSAPEGPFDRDCAREAIRSIEDRAVRLQQYLSVCFTVPAPLRGAPDAAWRRSQAFVQWVEAQCVAFEASLTVMGSNRMGIRAGHSELLSLAWKVLTGEDHEMPIPHGALTHALGRISVHTAGTELQLQTPYTRRCASVIEWIDLPVQTSADCLAPLRALGAQLTETLSFIGLPNGVARSVLQRQIGRLRSTADPAGTQIAGLERALDGLADQRFTLGQSHYSLAVLGKTRDTVDRASARACATLERLGFLPARQDQLLDASWFAQCPGARQWRTRWWYLSSSNFCGLAPFWQSDPGQACHGPWGGPLAQLPKPDGGHFAFHWHALETDRRLPTGHTAVLGPTGCGKTSLVLYLVGKSLKPGVRLLYLDADRGAEAALTAMGCAYARVRPGHGIQLNPLAAPATPDAIAFISRFVRMLCRLSDDEISSAEQQALAHAINVVQRMPLSDRTLLRLSENLPVNQIRLRDGLLPWQAGQALGWVFDEGAPSASLPDRLGVDLSECRNAGVHAAVSAVLMDRFEQRLDGAPSLLVACEAWRLLADPQWLAFLQRSLKTLRKKNGVVVLDTQSPADLIASGDCTTLCEQLATVICYRLPLADDPHLIAALGLSDEGARMVRSLDSSKRQFVVRQNARCAVAQLDWSHLPQFAKLLSPSREDLGAFADLPPSLFAVHGSSIHAPTSDQGDGQEAR